jgi:ubiquinone/menaquinone biosynthesis C-methylase UbiE
MQFTKNEVLSNKDQLNFIVDAADIKETDWVLDLGCGTGLLSNAIRNKTNFVVGIDLTEKMLEQAAEKNRNISPSILYVCGDGHRLPFFDQQFDIVMTRLTIHHFHDPSKILSEIHRVLKKGGKLIVADIVGSDDPEKQSKHNILEEVRDPSHIKFYNEGELKQILNTCHFVESKVTRWKTKRNATEWVEIMGDIFDKSEVIRLLEEGLQDDKLGIQVSKENNELIFYHHWICYVTQKEDHHPKNE